MPADYYDEDIGGGNETMTAEPDKEMGDESESPVEVVSKSFFNGPVKPGHRCTVEVTKVDDDSVLIKYIGSKDKGEAEMTDDEDDGEMMGKMPKGDSYYE